MRGVVVAVVAILAGCAAPSENDDLPTDGPVRGPLEATVAEIAGACPESESGFLSHGQYRFTAGVRDGVAYLRDASPPVPGANETYTLGVLRTVGTQVRAECRYSDAPEDVEVRVDLNVTGPYRVAFQLGTGVFAWEAPRATAWERTIRSP